MEIFIILVVNVVIWNVTTEIAVFNVIRELLLIKEKVFTILLQLLKRVVVVFNWREVSFNSRESLRYILEWWEHLLGSVVGRLLVIGVRGSVEVHDRCWSFLNWLLVVRKNGRWCFLLICLYYNQECVFGLL